ncbi:hypothetical protein [Methanosarcina horonobensis]|uniref:hypothetical protein n=1 Tax=Methanosarcina horonobensis TaxID=418008 RepID=UPI00064F18BD|nr:hypothetical protein [Methanosarcina horonobensis]
MIQFINQILLTGTMNAKKNNISKPKREEIIKAGETVVKKKDRSAITQKYIRKDVMSSENIISNKYL